MSNADRSLYKMQTLSKLTTSGSSVSISNIIGFGGGTASFTDASLVFTNSSGTIQEMMIGTASGGTLTISYRGLEQGDSIVENVGYKKERPAGSYVYVTKLAFDILDKDGNNTFTGNNIFDSNNGTKYGIRVAQLTTTQKNALSSVPNGVIIYDTTLGAFQAYEGGIWISFTPGGGTPDASETNAGKSEQATLSEQGAQTEIGGSGAPLFLNPKNTAKTSSGSSDENKIPLLNSDGLIDDFISDDRINIIKFKGFGGDGSDGNITGALTITGSNDTYIVKNYNNFAPGSNTVAITPTNCILHLKIKGNCDLTNTTFNFAGKGGVGGNGSNSSPTDGTNGKGNFSWYYTGCGRSGGNNAGTGTGTSTGGVYDYSIDYKGVNYNNFILLSGGAGGGGGKGDGGSGVGGNGGAGGGCVILEISGNLTFSSTTINCNGSNGSNNSGNGGGGGGGGGGTFICNYLGTLTGTNTPNVSGGTGGTGVSGYYGGGGGASMIGNGNGHNNGVGGNGANGYSLISKIE